MRKNKIFPLTALKTFSFIRVQRVQVLYKILDRCQAVPSSIRQSVRLPVRLSRVFSKCVNKKAITRILRVWRNFYAAARGRWL